MGGGAGAADVWAGRARWASVIQPTSDPRVDMVLWGTEERESGPVPVSWDELRQLRAGAGRRGSALRAQTECLAATCDATVLVLRLGITGQETALQATRKLAAAGAPLSGCVVVGAA